MSQNEKVLGIKLPEGEYNYLAQIANYLHKQIMYDVITKKNRPILSTSEPAELVKLATKHFISRYMIPDTYLVAFNLDGQDFQKYMNYAKFFKGYDTNDPNTGEKTKVLKNADIAELAYISMNTFIAQIEMFEQLRRSPSGNVMSQIMNLASKLGLNMGDGKQG